MPRTHPWNPLGLVVLKGMYDNNKDVTAEDFLKECRSRNVQPFVNYP